MDIGSQNNYPANSLSNFAAHRFTIDNVECNSMEGFLQSLKFKNPEMQKEVCKLVGKAAKFRGKKKNWWRDQNLYWQGFIYPRDSKKYQELLDRAYMCMFEQSDSFKRALGAAGVSSVFTHSIGKTDSHRTVLTTSEFCNRLMKLKNILFNIR